MKTLTLSDELFLALATQIDLIRAGVPTTPTDPAPPPPPPPVVTTTYPIGNVTLEDAMYLYRKDYDYRQALKSLPGAHQVHYDMLTKNGKTWHEMTGVAQTLMQSDLSRVINLAGVTHAYESQRFDTRTYTGPLKAIYDALVAAKLAGK